MTADRNGTARPIVRRLVQIGAVVVVYAVLLFVSAGRWDWVAGWAYLGIYVAFIAVNAVVMLPSRRELIAERGRVAGNVQRWDLVLAALYLVCGAALLVVAGLDERRGWTPAWPMWVPVAGGVLMTAGYSLFSWAMASNPFFSTVVRLQEDRGQTVVTAGPYRFVRHPGYLGGLLTTLGTPFLLGSWPAVAP